MITSEAVIGLPDDGTVRKYMLNGKTVMGVEEMEEDKQTLMDWSLSQENGTTVMSFAKYLDEDSLGIELGLNTFIYAVGSSNDLGWHADRGSFSLELTAEEETSTSSSYSVSSTSFKADTDLSYAPTSVGTSTVGEVVTPSPSIVSRPLMRTNEPTIVTSEGSQTVELSNTTTSSSPTVAGTEAGTSVDWTMSSSTDATESTPSPSVTDEMSSLQPTVTSSIASNATISEDGPEEDTESDTMIESGANAEDENGILVSAHAMGNFLLVMVLSLIMLN